MVSRNSEKHIKLKILIQTAFSIIELQKLHGQFENAWSSFGELLFTCFRKV